MLCICENVSLDKVAEVDGQGINGDADSPVGTGSNGGSQIFKRMASVWNETETQERDTQKNTLIFY